MSKAREWRSRIVGSEEVEPESLLANPFNFRVHPKAQRQAMEATLDTIGWIQQPVVNRRTGHVVDGHMRISAAIARGEKLVPVLYVELTEDEERAALASFDPLGSMAVVDASTLLELTTDLETGNSTLDQFIADQRNFAEGATLKGTGGDGERGIGQQQQTVKAVLPAEDLALVETALAETGAINRAEAFAIICRSYLAKGQHDAKPQGQPAPQPAPQAAPAARGSRNARRVR